jgi:hypothetical protein
MPGAPASMAKRAFLIGFPTQALSGTYQVTVGPDIEVAVETQLITIPITVTSVRFSFNGVLTSTPLAYTGATTAAQVLANLSTIAALAGKINVTGGNGGPYTVSFPGFADVQVALIGVSTFTGGTVSPTVLETTARLDTDLDVGVDILRGGDPTTGPLTAKTYANPLSTSPSSPPNSPGLGIVIPANSTITALLPITDQFKIVQGPAFDFNRHIQVFVDIVHSQDPDLEAVLIAPDGTEIRLFSNVGVNQRVTFDDFVSSPPPATGQVFQVATANPQIALSRL